MTNNSLKILAIGIVIASIYFLYNKDEEGIEIAEIETNQNEVVVGEKAINTNDREK